MDDGTLTIWIAFGAGILSFLSPCTLPLIPSYLGYMSGISLQQAKNGQLSAAFRLRVALHAVSFCIGLSVLYFILGFGVATFGHLLFVYRDLVRQVGGIVMTLMGLMMVGLFKPTLFLREWRVKAPTRRPLGYVGSFFVGLFFAAGWTPCVGPILASVLSLIVVHPTEGARMMAGYAAGFAIPFLLVALTLSSIRQLLRYSQTLMRAAGCLTVVMGLLLLTNQLAWLSIWLQRVTGYSGV